jgi:hypothetical protein
MTSFCLPAAALGTGQAVMTCACVTLGLCDPVVNGLGRGFELSSQIKANSLSGRVLAHLMGPDIETYEGIVPELGVADIGRLHGALGLPKTTVGIPSPCAGCSNAVAQLVNGAPEVGQDDAREGHSR